MMGINWRSDTSNAADGCCCSSSSNTSNNTWITTNTTNPVSFSTVHYDKLYNILQDICSDVQVRDEVHTYSNTNSCCEKEEESFMHTMNYGEVYKKNKNKIRLSEDFMKKVTFKPGCYDNTDIPFVDRVETYNDRVVKVTFIDGTFTKSVCSKNDAFDLDVGITICLMKRWLGKDGNRLYNNLIRNVHKRMDQKERLAKKEKELRAEIREKERKMKAKKAAKKEKTRQEQIEIQKQAYIDALKAVGGGVIFECNGDGAREMLSSELYNVDRQEDDLK